MARAYKKNRARGTRASEYKKKEYLEFILPKRTGKTDEEYLNEFIKLNEKRLEAAYRAAERRAVNTGGERQLADFHRDQPGIKAFTLKRFAGRKDFTQKQVKKIISENFTAFTQARREHIKELIETSYGSFFEELLARLNKNNTGKPITEIDWKRLSWTEDNTYRYIGEDGTIYRFHFTNYSPATIEWL